MGAETLAAVPEVRGTDPLREGIGALVEAAGLPANALTEMTEVNTQARVVPNLKCLLRK